VNLVSFTHVIATRFNIGKGTNAAWTKHRGQLLRQYCAKGIEAQIFKDFRWVLLVDENTPAAVLAPIVKGLPCDILHVGRLQPGKRPPWPKKLAAWCKQQAKTDWLVTTRLDSDDVLHPKYMAEIAAAVRPKTESLAFLGGYLIRVPENRVISVRKTTTNFQSVVEPTRDAHTAYSAPHGRIRLRYPPRILSVWPRWLIVQHGENTRVGDLKVKPIRWNVFTRDFGFLFSQADKR